MGRISADNERMRTLCTELGFTLCDVEQGVVEATLTL